jgi:PAS domain S-box-containing protein
MNEGISGFTEEILDSLPLGILVLSMEGRILTWNRKAEELTGIDKVRMLKKALFEDPELEAMSLSEKIRESLRSGNPFQSADDFLVDGSMRALHSTGKVITGKQGEISGLVVVLKEGKAEKDKVDQEAEGKVGQKPDDLKEEEVAVLGELARVKSQFLSTISHELRTPLNSVIGFSEILMDKTFGKINEKQERYLANIHESGKQLLSIINDIIDLFRGEEGELHLSPGEFPLSKTFNSIQTILKSPAVKKNISLAFIIDEKISMIRADEIKLKKIVYNLVDNAIKFTPPGGKVEVMGKPLNGEYIEISVIDNGIGIKPENRRRIFEKFEQIDGSLSREYEGAGLGLAVTKRLVELHGGKIWVKGRAGKGSKFIFTIPAR